MPRLRNEVTGAVLTVSDSTAARLGAGWVPADEKKPEPETPKRRQSRSSDTDK